MVDARGPRLLTDLSNAFKKDPNIDEYDVLPVLEPKHNRSPFILQDHKLGVESWAVKVLLKYTANKLIGWRGRDASEKFTDPIEVCHLSRAVLMFNPDNYTAWNIRYDPNREPFSVLFAFPSWLLMCQLKKKRKTHILWLGGNLSGEFRIDRKELIENGYLSFSDDLTFGALILSKHPKSVETFIHRRWLFQQLLDHCLSSSSGSNASCSAAAASNEELMVNMEAIDVDVNASPEPGVRLNGAFSLESSRLLKSHTHRELELSEKAAERYPCNYHAWSHRIWVVQHCLNCSIQILLSELKVTELWTSKHISDHSGFHYRQFLLTELHRAREQLMSSFSQNSTELFINEMAYICDLIHTFPGHEALWYHRRFLFHSLLQQDHLEARLQMQSSVGPFPVVGHTGSNELDAIRATLISQEIDLVSSKQTNSSFKYDQLLVRNYVNWLKML